METLLIRTRAALDTYRARLSRLADYLDSTPVKKRIHAIDTLADTAGSVVNMLETSAHTFLYFDVKDLDSFKDERLVALLAGMEELHPTNVNEREYASAYNKTYTYRWYVDNAEMMVVSIDAYVKEDSTACRRVKVGMEIPEPRPIYKMECDE